MAGAAFTLAFIKKSVGKIKTLDKPGKR